MCKVCWLKNWNVSVCLLSKVQYHGKQLEEDETRAKLTVSRHLLHTAKWLSGSGWAVTVWIVSKWQTEKWWQNMGRSTRLFTSGRDPMTVSNMDTTKDQLGYLQEQKWLKDSYMVKAHCSLGGSSQKLRVWSTVHSLQASQQVGEGPFQVTQLI